MTGTDDPDVDDDNVPMIIIGCNMKACFLYVSPNGDPYVKVADSICTIREKIC